ncbi:MAG TPA: NAD(P)-binding domain-containing protein [Thermoanaerobaculia bacterium]
MRFGVLGTGSVGQTIGGKLVALGHEVKMGARQAGNPKAAAWVRGAGGTASQGTFSEAAAFGEVVFNCTAGTGSLEALQAAGEGNLRGKILVDVANPLDFSKGMPPTLFISGGGDSLAERIQAAFPETRVVKALNTVNASVMVDPAKVPGETDLFVCGNDAEAKSRVMELLRRFGWKSVIDLGDVTAARGTEAYLLLWLRLWGALGTPTLNVKVLAAKA